ncbi:MAG: hypothetical protein ACYTGZ_09865 [Planctomycetota bacterium]|jgi:hypothetical protein
MIAAVLQSLPMTLLVEGGIFITLALGLRLSRRGPTPGHTPQGGADTAE